MKVLGHEFSRFVIGGAVNTTITYAVYLMLELVMPPGVAYTLVYVFGICLSYAINTYFVFHTKGTVRSGLQYPLVYAAQYLIGLAVLTLLTHFGMDSRSSPAGQSGMPRVVVVAQGIGPVVASTREIAGGPSARYHAECHGPAG